MSNERHVLDIQRQVRRVRDTAFELGEEIKWLSTSGVQPLSEAHALLEANEVLESFGLRVERLR